MTLPFAHYVVCHFGATYIDGMTGNPPPPFILDIQRGPGIERFDEILIVGYFLNRHSILDVQFANFSATLAPHIGTE